jgi:sphingolipid delta-4 desaturase
MSERAGHDFIHSETAEPHQGRARDILGRHTQIRSLAGRNPWSAPLIAALVGTEVALAWALRDRPVWMIAISAFCLGAFLSHTLWVLIHECAHNLVFANGAWNRLAAMVANLPHLLPSAISFQKYHLKHHAFQGVYELDADMPSRWEASFIGGSFAAKAAWLLLFPIFQVTRPPRLKQIALFDRWVVLNIAVQLAFDTAIWMLIGPKAILFLGLSFFFSVGLHPLGARWIQEHYLVDGIQETSSYYGPMNRIALNVGYHNEHHDFPWVPWNRLPQIRRAAPEVYDSLTSHSSWTLLLLRFLLDTHLSLWSRTVRTERGGSQRASRKAAASRS